MSAQHSEPQALERRQAGTGGSAPLERAMLQQLLNGYTNTQIIYVMAKLGIADLLRDGPCHSHALAEATGSDALRLRRLLRGCVRCGLVAEQADGSFALLPLGACLASDQPGSLRDVALLAGEQWYGAWGGLLQAVQSGATAFDQVFGQSFFEHLGQQPEAKTRFNNFMASRTAQAAQELLRVFDFAPYTTVVDVGGGNGSLLAEILAADPRLNGIVFDSAAVAGEAQQRIAARGLSQRCRVVEGSFWEQVPAGGDLYMVSQILHDWSDEQCVQILSNCRRAMQPGGSMLVIEQLLPEQVHKSTAVVDMDLAMLVLTGGRERSEAEYRELLEHAGFGETRCTRTRFAVALIEGRNNQTLS